MRRTKIICTIGPASRDPEVVRGLLERGMDVARLNMAHGTLADHRSSISIVRRAAEECGRDVAILVDVKGPEIRTGDVRAPIPIAEGDEVVFSPHLLHPGEQRTVITVNYEHFASDVAEASTILIDNGELEFSLLAITGKDVIAKAKNSGTIGSRRHINLPGADIDLPSITSKDWGHIRFAIEQRANFIALSFVRSPDEVQELKTHLSRERSATQVIAKIETQQAINRLLAIVKVSDAIMVARGDLGAEIPFEVIPTLQDEIVALCAQYKTPVIVATHMLESMIEHPLPTRAEATDIAHAVLTGAQYVMLSAETATGKYPLDALEAMRKIVEEAERRKGGE